MYAGNGTMKIRLVLEKVQVTPFALSGIIYRDIILAALRAPKPTASRIFQIYA
jgi:hypothetical protein